MASVKIGIGIHHFRLDPDTELDALRLDLVHKGSKTFGEFILVFKPVAKSRFVVVARAKPTVVHHQHIDADLGRLFGKRHKRGFVNVKIASLPGIQHHGMLFQCLFRHNVVTRELVQIPRHSAKAVC